MSRIGHRATTLKWYIATCTFEDIKEIVLFFYLVFFFWGGGGAEEAGAGRAM